MATPAILLQRGVNNESQDLEMTTVKLTPNATSNFQTRFQIPKMGNVLDSNSSLVWTISWDSYDAARTTDICLLKNFSGGLNTIQRARFYIGSKEIFSCDDVGHLIHIKNLNRNPDYQEEVLDMELGSVHGYYDVAQGKVQLGTDTNGFGAATGAISGAAGIKTFYNRYARPLGSYSNTPSSNKGIECSVMLSEIFSALQSIQLPMDLEDMRLEIDWNTTFSEVAYIAQYTTGSGAPSESISIQNPVLLLDYLTFPEEARAGLGQVLQSGVALPYIHTSLSTKIIPPYVVAPENPPAAAVDTTTDIQLALQGKLLMKMYVSHRLNNTNEAGTDLAPQIGNGRCRSQRGLDLSYNLYVNDLAIHDLPVDTDSMQYSFFSIAEQGLASVIPGQVAYNAVYGAAANNNDVNSAEYVVCDCLLPTAVGGVSSITGPEVRDMVAGCQSYIGFDLAKYPQGSGARGTRVVPADAGYRSGSSATILRITEKGATAAQGRDSQPNRAKTVQVFTEEVRVLQIRGGIADIFDA